MKDLFYMEKNIIINNKENEIEFINCFLDSVCSAYDESDEYKEKVLNARGFIKGDSNYEKCIFLNNDELYKLFLKDSATGENNKYLDSDLEPFVYRYIKALNTIGIMTDSSCDDWHNRKPNKNCISISFMSEFYYLFLKFIHDFDERLPSSDILGFQVSNLYGSRELSEYEISIDNEIYNDENGITYGQIETSYNAYKKYIDGYGVNLYIPLCYFVNANSYHRNLKEQNYNERLRKYMLINNSAKILYEDKEHFNKLLDKAKSDLRFLFLERKEDHISSGKIYRYMSL